MQEKTGNERGQEQKVSDAPIKIIYLDDEPDLLEVGKLFLELDGEFKVHATSSHQEALQMVVDQDCDAVLSDYQMPGMNGIEFLKRVRSLDKDIPFIIFTGRGREEVVIEALNFGADFYLQKGGNPTPQFKELANALHKLVERNRTGRLLQRTESLLVTVAKHVMDVIFRVSLTPELSFEYVSPAIFSISGFKQSDFYDDPMIVMRMAHPDDKWMLDKWIQGEDIAGDHTWRWIDQNGRHIWIEQSNIPIWDTNGKVVAFEGIARDVTKKVESEENLRHSEELYRLIADNTADIVWLSDLHGRSLYSSPALIRLQLQSGKRENDDIQGIILPEDREDFDRALHHIMNESPERAREKRITKGLDVRVQMPGDIRTFHIDLTLLHDEGFDPGRILGVGQDVTDRTNALRQLHGERHFLQNILSSIQDGIAVLDTDMHVIMANPTLQKWYELKGQIEGRLCYEIFHDRDEPCIDCPSITCIKTLKAAREVVPRRDAQGQTIGWLELHSFPLKDDTGNLSGCIEYVRDITEIKRAQEALQLAQQKVDILNSISRQDIMSHLTALKNNIQLVKVTDKEFARSRYPEALTRSAEAIERQVRFANDFQSLGQQGYSWHSVEDLFRRAASKLPSGIEVDIKARGWYVHADRMIDRIFPHLVENSIQHGGNVKRITLRTEQEREELHIIYADDGQGISEEKKDAIFQIAHGEQAGIGLFLCRSILEVSGMKIIENGIEGGGARFEIVVPLGKYQAS
jgi:PAS domain S-box-containing protein